MIWTMAATWNPARVRAALATANRPRLWLWQQLVDHDCDVGLSTIYNWLNNVGEPDEATADLIRNIIKEIKHEQAS